MRVVRRPPQLVAGAAEAKRCTRDGSQLTKLQVRASVPIPRELCATGSPSCLQGTMRVYADRTGLIQRRVVNFGLWRTGQ